MSLARLELKKNGIVAYAKKNLMLLKAQFNRLKQARQRRRSLGGQEFAMLNVASEAQPKSCKFESKVPLSSQVFCVPIYLADLPQYGQMFQLKNWA